MDQKIENIVGKRENVVTSIFSFSCNVFINRFHLDCKSMGLFGKGLFWCFLEKHFVGDNTSREHKYAITLTKLFITLVPFADSVDQDPPVWSFICDLQCPLCSNIVGKSHPEIAIFFVWGGGFLFWLKMTSGFICHRKVYHFLEYCFMFCQNFASKINKKSYISGCKHLAVISFLLKIHLQKRVKIFHSYLPLLSDFPLINPLTHMPILDSQFSSK